LAELFIPSRRKRPRTSSKIAIVTILRCFSFRMFRDSWSEPRLNIQGSSEQVLGSLRRWQQKNVPKIVLTINHASGAGYYAMAGQGFDPDFIFSLPTGRMGVMEGDSAVQAIFGTQLDKLKKAGKDPDADVLAEMDKVRDTYEQQLDAKHAAARGLVDAIVTPENLRNSLILALETTLNTSTPHIGAFVLPAI